MGIWGLRVLGVFFSNSQQDLIDFHLVGSFHLGRGGGAGSVVLCLLAMLCLLAIALCPGSL